MGDYDDEYLEPLEPWDDIQPEDDEADACPLCGARPDEECGDRTPDGQCAWEADDCDEEPF